MRHSGASYLKYKFIVNDNFSFEGKFDPAKDSFQDLNINDKIAIKLIDKKDFEISLKKKKFLFSKSVLDNKKFKLTGLSNKCDMEKDVQMASFPMTFTFSMREPIREKEITQTPIKKLIIDSFPEPFRSQA